MENCIERMLKNAGFAVNHTTKSITIDVWGVNAYVTYELDYDTYDKMSVNEALNMGDIITNTDKLIQSASIPYLLDTVKSAVEESMQTKNYNKFCADFGYFCNTWGKEESVIRAGFDSLKNDIETAICDLDMRTFTSQNFDELLDEIVVSGSQNLIEVSSKYSTIKTYGQTKDDTFEAVDSYIKTLMNSGELAFIDFDSWEYEYALKLGAKYS